MKNIKNILSVSILTTMGLLSGQKAFAQNQNTYENPDFRKKQTTPYHCKFIENNTKLVVNYKDTFFVFGTHTDNNQVVCDLGPSMPNFVCNMTYYLDTPWVSSLTPFDSLINRAMIKDYKLGKKYYEYQNNGDYEKRDSVELLLLENRQHTLEKLNQRQK